MQRRIALAPNPRLPFALMMLFTLILLLIMSACTQLGLTQAQTFNQRWAVALSAVTQARQTTTQLLAAKKMTALDARHIQEQCDNVRAGLDIARDQSAKDLPAASNKLEMVSTSLRAVEAYLLTRQTAPPSL